MFPSDVENDAIRLAEESGRLLLASYEKIRTIEHKGEVNNLVTDADRQSEAYLVAAIQEAYPSHAILGEEGTGHQEGLEEKEILWIIDPLDGTVNYAHQLPIWCVSIGVVRRGQPWIGVVHIPLLGETFHARAGCGAWRGQTRLHVSQRPRLQDSVLATGFPYDKHLTPQNNAENVPRFLPQIRGLRRMGAAAVDLAYVACGRLDGYWEEKLKPWDIAAGILLVREAGGIVTDYRGRADIDLRKGHVLASNGLIHDAMLSTLQPYVEAYRIG